MKESLEQAGRFFPSDAQAAEVLQPTDRALHGPAALVAPQGPAILRGFESVGAMRGDHLDAARSERSVQRIAVVGFVADDALGVVVADHEVKQSLDQSTLVRPSLGGVGGNRETFGIDQQHDLHSLADARNPDAVAALAGLAEGCVYKAFVELEAAALLHAPTGFAHDALEHARSGPAVKPVVDRALGAEFRGEILPLGAVVQDPEESPHHLALVRWWPTALRTAWRVWNLITYPIELCISKLKHGYAQIYPCQHLH